MIKTGLWTHPMKFTGIYPSQWNGYTFLQWSSMSKNWHEGVDYNWRSGTDDLGLDVVACATGIVEYVSGWVKGWGYHIFIKHDHPKHGIIYSHYAHLKTGSIKVKVGDVVRVGDKIAECGATGWTDMSPHLHFEIRKPIGLGWNFYPTPAKGWNKAKTSEYYLDPYKFIEEEQKNQIINPPKEGDNNMSFNPAKKLPKEATEIDEFKELVELKLINEEDSFDKILQSFLNFNFETSARITNLKKKNTDLNLDKSHLLELQGASQNEINTLKSLLDSIKKEKTELETQIKDLKTEILKSRNLPEEEATKPNFNFANSAFYNLYDSIKTPLRQGLLFAYGFIANLAFTFIVDNMGIDLSQDTRGQILAYGTPVVYAILSALDRLLHEAGKIKEIKENQTSRLTKGITRF